MDLKITGKTALVTGGSRGIGFATANLLALEGAKVVTVARSRADANANPLITSIQADLSSLDGVYKLIKIVAMRGIVPDIIINNLGGNLGFTDPL